MTCSIKLMCILVLLAGGLFARDAAAQTVMFDNSHGERFLIDGTGPLQLSGLAQIIQEAGAKVATCEKELTDESLKGVDGLVISGAFRPLSPPEIDAVVRFLFRGGKLAVMLHIGPPLQSLLHRLEVGYTNGVIRERENILEGEPLNFRVTRLTPHPLTQGLSAFSLYGVWGVRNLSNSAQIIAATSPEAWVDLDGSKVQKKESTASFGVAVAGNLGNGGFVVFGDDAIFQNKFLDKDNRRLAANLAAWLK